MPDKRILIRYTTLIILLKKTDHKKQVPRDENLLKSIFES